MEAVSLILSSPIRWKIHESDPVILDLELGPGKVVNPLLFNTNPIKSLTTYKDGYYFISNRMFTISLQEKTFSDFNPNDDAFENQISGFLQWIRCLAFLFTLDTTTGLMGGNRISELPTEMPRPSEAPPSGNENGYIQEYYLKNFVDINTAKLALEKLKAGESVPIHQEFLVDAFAAFRRNDYRHCMLYAAIAAESLAAGRLEKEYARRLTEHPNPDMRVLELPQAGGITVRKDPVYEALNMKTDFSSLIHERPLYLFHRSLMVDQPETYRLARKLYNTRNKIVHRGQLGEEDDKAFAINRADSWTALNCVADIFSWFGEDRIKYPSYKLVPANMTDHIR